jgi:hypothetical protein
MTNYRKNKDEGRILKTARVKKNITACRGTLIKAAPNFSLEGMEIEDNRKHRNMKQETKFKNQLRILYARKMSFEMKIK